jgi:hypothetical protein
MGGPNPCKSQEDAYASAVEAQRKTQRELDWVNNPQNEAAAAKFVSAGGKLTQIAGIELTHPQQSYCPDLFRSGGDDITHAGRQNGEAAAGVARRGRIDS